MLSPCVPVLPRAAILACLVGLGGSPMPGSPLRAESPAETAAAADGFPAARSPAESLAAIVMRPGMDVELVAQEPLVADPVALDWGADGRLWVVEMGDYPNGLDGHGRPGGRVRVLEDRDGDGRYDHSTVFLDEIPFPTGLKLWRDGVIVSAAPEIFYAEDQDGDGKADLRKTLYRGFVEGNQQHRVNGLRWGLDNWLHVANGDSGGRIVSERTGQAVDIRGRDLRIQPDAGRLEPISGQTQFGRSRDDWGNWFGGNNSNPIWHYVLEDRYLRRNPHFAPPAVKRQISDPPGAAPVYPQSRTLARFNDLDKANRFTSACSPMIYRDTWLGPDFQANAFLCEPVHNLVSRQVLTADGLSFHARRAEDEQQSEFLASRDSWFRPTMVRTGPDGALWITDMYRLVIEHPKWIPAEWQARLNLRDGADKGRIYRVFPQGKRPPAIPNLAAKPPAEWVDTLESSNGWQRDMAQQLLVWRADPGTVDPLREKVRRGRSPMARLQALCALDGIGQADSPTLLAALSDPHPHVRRHAIRIAEPRADAQRPLRSRLLALVEDPAPSVRQQLAYTLGEVSGEEAAEGLARLGLRHAEDELLRAAVLSSVTADNVAPLLRAVLAAGPWEEPSSGQGKLAGDLLRCALPLNGKQAVGEALRTLLSSAGDGSRATRMSALAELLGVLSERKVPWSELADDSTREAFGRTVDRARRVISEPAADLAERVAAARLLGRLPAPADADHRRLAELLEPQQPLALQSAAVEGLADGARGGTQLADQLLAGWNSHTPPLRSQILDVLLRRAETTRGLLRAIEDGRFAVAQIDPRRREQLARNAGPGIRELVERLFDNTPTSSRREVLQTYADAKSSSGDVGRGRRLFEKQCAVCHRLEDRGHPVGPDLTALTDKSAEALLVAIIDPNRAVEDKFLDYQVVTVDGRQWNGMLAGETGTAITLQGQEGKQQQILRSQIEILRTTGKSLMPEGMERQLSVEQMADLLAYLRSVGGAGQRP